MERLDPPGDQPGVPWGLDTTVAEERGVTSEVLSVQPAVGVGAVITEIWQLHVLRARPPSWPPRQPVNPALPPGSGLFWHPGLQAIFPSFVSLKP